MTCVEELPQNVGNLVSGNSFGGQDLSLKRGVLEPGREKRRSPRSPKEEDLIGLKASF